MMRLVAQDAELSTFVAQGALSPDEILKAYSVVLNSSPTRLTLLDLSSASLAHISGDSMRELARRVAELGKKRRKAGRTAIVCSRDVDFGMARMFSTLASLEGHPLKFAVFPGPNSARAWLRGETGE